MLASMGQIHQFSAGHSHGQRKPISLGTGSRWPILNSRPVAQSPSRPVAQSPSRPVTRENRNDNQKGNRNSQAGDGPCKFTWNSGRRFPEALDWAFGYFSLFLARKPFGARVFSGGTANCGAARAEFQEVPGHLRDADGLLALLSCVQG